MKKQWELSYSVLTIGMIQITQETKYFMDENIYLKILMAWNVAN